MSPDFHVWATRLRLEETHLGQRQSGQSGPYVRCVMWGINSPFFSHDIQGNNDAIIAYDAIVGSAAAKFHHEDKLELAEALDKAAQIAEIATPFLNR